MNITAQIKSIMEKAIETDNLFNFVIVFNRNSKMFGIRAVCSNGRILEVGDYLVAIKVMLGEPLPCEGLHSIRDFIDITYPAANIVDHNHSISISEFKLKPTFCYSSMEQ